MKPTRYESEIELTPNPKYKATGKVMVAIGAVGHSDPVPAVLDKDGKEIQPAVPPALVWSAELHQVIVRSTSGPAGVRNELVASLEHILAELKKFDLPNG